jgi:O-antigen/teichoic acid export membrane protein
MRSESRPRADGVVPLDVTALAEPELEASQVTRGAVRGSVLVMARTLGGQFLGLLASIAIARLLAPAEFGQFAIAIAIQQAGAAVISTGLPAGLLQQREWPSPARQHAIAGFTIALASGIALGALAIAFGLLPLLGARSTTVEVIAIACASLPVLALRVIPMALLRRQLRFERLLTADISAQVVFYGAALPAAYVGFGAYGLAAAVPVSALANTIILARLQPWSRGYSLDLGVIRGLAGFGTQVATIRILTLAQEAGLVSLCALIGGQALAGYFGMGQRMLGLPYAAVRSVQSVGFPALARVGGSGVRSRQTAKAAAVSATAVGLLLALIVGAADPFVSTLLGERWSPTVEILVPSSVGLMLFATVGGLVTSLALAEGDSRSPLVATGLQILVSTVLVVAAVGSLGALGAGIAVGAGYLVYSMFLLARRAPAEVRGSSGSVLRAMLVAALAAGAGWLTPTDDGLAALGAAVGASGVTWLVLSWAMTRTELKMLLKLLQTHLRPATSTA